MQNTDLPEIPQDATIDLENPLPYYHQIKKWLHEKLLQGVYQPGQQIPSEAALCKAFKVSRTVVREAIDDLANEGLLYRRQGKRTLVAAPKITESLVQNLTGFYQDMVAHGLTPITRVLEQRIIPAPPLIADRLCIPAGEKTINLTRLRLIDGEPIAWTTTYIPYAICPALLDEDLTAQSLYTLLEERYGLIIARGRRVLEAIVANAEDARLLGIKSGAPLVLIKNVSYLRDGRPIEYFEGKHRGDRSQFEVELIRVAGADRSSAVREYPSQLPGSNGLKFTE